MSEIINRETGECLEIIKENDDGKLVIAKEACGTITALEHQMREMKAIYDEYKKALLEAMETYGVKKIDTEDFVVSYVAPTERISLDSKKVETEYPEVYRECMKISDVKSSVRVGLKKKDEVDIAR